jgi:hypothetical protein
LSSRTGQTSVSTRSEQAIAKYCAGFAEAEIQQLTDFPAQVFFRHVIVVPAYRENTDFLQRLQSLAATTADTLLILIVNQPERDADCRHSKALLDAALTSGNLRWQNAQMNLVEWQNGSAVLTVDRFRAELRIPDKQGVGLARKIGCDLALALQQRGRLLTRFIHNSDADAFLPDDYLIRTQNLDQVSGALFPFRHRTDTSPTGTATALYERHLRYYVAGLTWAGSPYAYHTIGSCMAISIAHYAQVRGFPKRAAGEDFYLLNKLTKLAPLARLPGSPIELQARGSSRVPFGTGPAVDRILALDSPAEFTSYDPEVFSDLKILLDAFDDLWQNRARGAWWLAQLPSRVRDACLALNIDSLFDHLCTQVRDEEQALRQIHAWFDAFRTLKFIHHLQAHHFPAMALTRALVRARPFLKELGEEGESFHFGPSPKTDHCRDE